MVGTCGLARPVVRPHGRAGRSSLPSDILRSPTENRGARKTDDSSRDGRDASPRCPSREVGRLGEPSLPMMVSPDFPSPGPSTGATKPGAPGAASSTRFATSPNPPTSSPGNAPPPGAGPCSAKTSAKKDHSPPLRFPPATEILPRIPVSSITKPPSHEKKLFHVTFPACHGNTL